MLIPQHIYFLSQKFDIWRQVGCFPQLKTLLFAYSKNATFLLQLLILFFQLSHFWPFNWFGCGLSRFRFSSSSHFILDFSLIDLVASSLAPSWSLNLFFCSFNPKWSLSWLSICPFELFPPSTSFLECEMRSLMSSVTLSCWVMLFPVVFLSSMQRRIPPFLPWAPSISCFYDAWEELAEILKDKLIFSFLFFHGVFQVSIRIEVCTAATAAHYIGSLYVILSQRSP